MFPYFFLTVSLKYLTTGKLAWNENSECYPQDAYGRSKYEAEKLLLSLQDENFKVAIVRSALVYGAGVKANMYNLVKLVHKFPVILRRMASVKWCNGIKIVESKNKKS